MTQDKVDLIYNYLHENYRYEDGRLFIKKWVSGRSKKNLEAGHFHLPKNKGRVLERLHLRIDCKSIFINLDRAIFCFHYKIIPQCIEHVNGNPVDHKIENLKESNSFKVNNKNISSWKGVRTYKGKHGIRYYPCLQIHGKYKTLGGYNSYEEAHQAYLKAKAELQ